MVQNRYIPPVIAFLWNSYQKSNASRIDIAFIKCMPYTQIWASKVQYCWLYTQLSELEYPIKSPCFFLNPYEFSIENPCWNPIEIILSPYKSHVKIQLTPC